MLTTRDVARQLGVSRRRVCALIIAGRQMAMIRATADRILQAQGHEGNEEAGLDVLVRQRTEGGGD